ncbi:MAG: hypothetical protein ABIT04_09680 [Novosphingobium sp.]
MHLRRMTAAVSLGLSLAIPAQARADPPATRDKSSHPAEVAFIKEEQGWVFRRFPTGERLYYNDRDPKGRSLCNLGCSSTWPPVPAPADAVSTGYWSVVVRSDGTRQWALKGKPLYTRFHDTPEVATGDGIGGVWHVVPYVQLPYHPPVSERPGVD